MTSLDTRCLGCKLKAMPTPPPLDFDLWDEDGLLVEHQPELFVDLSPAPIIFTIKGIKYFKPRFELIGISLASLKTQDQFKSAHAAWLAHEWVLLNDHIDIQAKSSKSANPHQFLQAVLSADLDQAEKHLERLEHKKRAGLTVVPAMKSKDQ